MNLAVKSSLFSKKSPHNTITSDIMKLIGEISAEYQRYNTNGYSVQYYIQLIHVHACNRYICVFVSAKIFYFVQNLGI